MPKGTWKLYPNIYTVLVGRPGLGKGAAVNPALALFKEANVANILSDRLTIEYVLEKLSKGFPVQTYTAKGVTFGSDSTALLFSPELSIFITASNVTLPILADLWDAREQPLMYGTRHKGEYLIKAPCVSLLGGSTQEWLIDAIPSTAVGGGFTRRVNFVFAKERQQYIPYSSNGLVAFPQDLVDDLRAISADVRGAFRLEPTLIKEYDDYCRRQIPDEFSDEAEASYITTKWAHALKLAMVISASRTSDMIIRVEDWRRATDAVDKVARDIKLVFRAVGESDLVIAGDRVLRFIEAKGYTTRNEILAVNWRHISTDDLTVVLATLTQGGLIAETTVGNQIVYRPKPVANVKKAP